MLRKRLAASVAVAPLLFLAHGAFADTTIITAETKPVATGPTATVGDLDSQGNVTIGAAGSVKPTTAGAAAVTLNSDNTVTNEGALATNGLDNTTGILVVGGNTGSVLNKGSITLGEDHTDTDADNDGDADNALATGTLRYGIRTTGAFTGPISNVTSGVINIRGNNSAGISIEGPLTGAFTNSGAVGLVGDNGYAIHIAGPVSGNVRVEGTVAAQGKGSTGVAIDGNVAGAVSFQGGIAVTGYRYYTARPTTKVLRDKLTEDDGVDSNLSNGFDPALFSGPAVRIGGDVIGGVLFDAAPIIDPNDTDTDQDNDGVADTAEIATTISLSGGGAAVLIGSDTQTVTLGAVDPGVAANNFGFISRGSINAAGLFDGVGVTAIQIGGSTGKTTLLTNGARIAGAVVFSAYEANAAGVHLTSGARANTIALQGIMNGVVFSDARVAATLNGNLNNSVTGVLIDAGAIVGTIRNSGTLSVAGQGERVDAIAIRDLNGSVTLVENTGKILAGVAPTDDIDDHTDDDTDPSNEEVKGTAIAIDVQGAAAGVTVRQSGVVESVATTAENDTDRDGVLNTNEPVLLGSVLFGAHDDRLELLNGTMIGEMSFGAGEDTLLINGGATATGLLADGDGDLHVELLKGSLTITNPTAIAATSLNVTNGSSLTFTANPGAGTVTRLNVDTANLGNGTKLGIRFTSLLTGDVKYTVIKATGGLTVGALDPSLLGSTPYLYQATASADIAAGEVYLDVRRRTAGEIGLNAQGTAAYNAIYQALFNDAQIRDAFLAQTTRNGFIGQFDQMLPNQNEGLFSALQMAGQTITDVIATRPDPHQRYGPDSFWLQEFNTRIQRDTGASEGSDTKAFGFIGGYESMGDGGALGATLSYVNAQEEGSSAQVGEQSSVSLFEAGVYWRGYMGNFRFGVRGGVGYASLESDRRFVYVTDSDGDSIADTTTLEREAHSKWNGFTASGGVDIAYEFRAGRFYARPSAGLDYLYLSEGAHTETGAKTAAGTDGFDLSYDSRTSSRLSAEAMLAMGAEFGRDSWWRPEIRFGYRARLAGAMGDNVVRFSNGSPFTVAGSDSSGGALVLGFSIRAGTPMSYLALEGDSELSDEEMRYLIRLVGRMMF